MGTPRLFLEVIGGVDLGARIDLDAATRTIGRADDSDLVLHDRAVSRQHAIVTRTETGAIHFEICPSKLAAVVKGCALHQLDLQPGIELLIGNTTLAVRSSDDKHAVSNGNGGTTERRGAGVSALHLAALDALIAMLNDVHDVTELVSRTQAWCVEYSMATDVQLGAVTDSATTAPFSKHDDGMVRVGVPMPGDSDTLVFTCPSSTGEVQDSLRKTLVMAGQFFAFTLNDVRRSPIAVDKDGPHRATPCSSSRTVLGSSAAARKISDFITKLSDSNATVLLEGETGTGKSFVARLIHEHGPRAKEPLQVVNCATIPEALFESEFFGHERGAFTGAEKSIGKFEAAGRGTVVLEEIDALSLSSQAKLLGVLDERHFERLGSNHKISLHARVICATNHDLKAMIVAGEFRSDLYYRISAMCVPIPPLRERGEDLLLLAEHFLSVLSAANCRRVNGFSKEALKVITSYSWPGNVRELRNAIERALVLGDRPMIEAFDLAHVVEAMVDQALSPTSFPTTSPTKRAPIERPAIENAIAVTDGNLSKAAAMLGISRSTLYRKRAEFEASDPGKPPTTPKK
ncbi:MAG: sigma 54-interacting transcriptional regulator [Polyangiaceae bacterium]|nr:sigma 54-interacting transcriptional regulator [Polyangiaceae bacterium]